MTKPSHSPLSSPPHPWQEPYTDLSSALVKVANVERRWRPATLIQLIRLNSEILILFIHANSGLPDAEECWMLLSGSCGYSAPPKNWRVKPSLDFTYGKNKSNHQSCRVCIPPCFMSWPGENSWCLLKASSDVTRHHRGKHKSKCKYSALSQHWPNVINVIWDKHFSYSLLVLGTQIKGWDLLFQVMWKTSPTHEISKTKIKLG